MQNKYDALFTPMKIGSCEIKNRIVLCPMGGTSVIDGMMKCGFNKEAANFFIERAKNNVGLIIPGIAPLRAMLAGQWMYKHPEVFKPVKPMMDEIHKYGAKLFIQLTAGFGRSAAGPKALLELQNSKVLSTLAKPIIDIGAVLASPSELPSRWMPDVTCRALTVDEIHHFVEAYAKTALLCKEAGVDGVEVHAVHEGYLLDQFTLPYTNHRTDEYGGSFENRYRFAVEVVQAIKKLCGKDFPVSLRYSVISKTQGFGVGALPGEQYTEVGRDMAESERAAKYLQDAGYDALNADNGTYDAWYWAHPPVYMPENCNLEDVAHIRKFVDIPVICAGRMDPAVAAEAIAEKRIDGAGFARQFLCDEEFITKIMEDRIDDIRPCICCHNACFPMANWKGVGAESPKGEMLIMARCALNPRTMNTKRFTLTPAKEVKRVAVVGGGIGGMEAARVAALRGHKVTLYEKSDRLGGVFIAAAAPDFKEKDRELIEWYRRQIASLPITVKLNTEVGDIASLEADRVIVATGARPRKLPVKGIERSIEAIDYLLGNKAVTGENVVVVGGGLTGCEIAYDLIRKGKKPVIVEMQDDLMKVVGLCMANSSMLRDIFRHNKTEILLNTKLSEITEKGVVLEGPNGRSEIAADSVIISAGYIGGAPLAEKAGKKAAVIGDADGVGNLKKVVWQAYDAALKI